MKKVSPVRLYFHFMSIHLRSAMQYKMSFILTALGQLATSFTAYLGIHYLFERFGSIGGFEYSESLLCFASILTSFSLAECFVRGLDTFPSLVSGGNFDRILVRPRSELFLTLTSKFEFSRIGRLAFAVMVFVYAIPQSGVDFTPARVFCLVLMIVCGFFVFAGVYTVYAFISFFTIEGLEFMNIVTDGVREYGKYPLAVYGRAVLTFTTYVIPYALVQYYPFLYLTGRETGLGYMLAPLAALLFLIPCAILWRIGIRHYKSTGS